MAAPWMRLASAIGGITIAVALVCVGIAVVLARLAWVQRAHTWARGAAVGSAFALVLGVSQLVTPVANGHFVATVLAATAAVLGLLAVTLVSMALRAMRTSSAEELLEGANRRLRAEVRERESAEEEILKVNAELEARVAERTRELERSNRELEQFAYVASHDLREPLRMIASYTDLLARRYRGKLDDTADEFIAYILDGCQRMRQLIIDLLEYSRVDRQRSPQLVDADDALEVACRDLAVPIARADAVITHDPLPHVVCTRVQLVQLLENLLRNALTYRADRPTRIHVGVQEKDDEVVLTVRDNGLGFEMRHADRIFGMFQRLHVRGEYPGTGMGLAMCRKIMECHGGRIWANAEPGVGATFSCAFPRANAPTAVAS